MNTKVLQDCDRIEALGLFGSTRRRAGVITWIGDLGYKFLVIDGVLVVGLIIDHSQLYAAWVTWEMPIEVARAQVEELSVQQYEGNWRVTAAGELDQRGEVIGWKSTCYRLTTPLEMRGEIEECLRKLMASGQLAPR